MSLPNPNPILDPNAPYFQDNQFVRADFIRNNNTLIWQNFEWLDWATKTEKIFLENTDRLGLADSEDSFNLKGILYSDFLNILTEYLDDFFDSINFLKKFAVFNWLPVSPTGSTFLGLNSIAFGDGIFVTVREGGGSSGGLRSGDDGFSWNTFTLTANLWTGVAFGNSVFVAVSSNGTLTARSTDGAQSFSNVTAAENNQWQDIAFGGTAFVAIANSGTNRVMRSTNNGVSWSAVLVELSAWKAITFGNSLFVAVANGGPGTLVIRSADDGATWSPIAAPINAWQDITYGNGVFVAVGGSQIMRSTNGGANWSLISGIPVATALNCIAFVNNIFVAFESGLNSVFVSTDNGQTWAKTSGAGPFDWRSIVAGNDRLIAIAYANTTNAPIARSMKLPDETFGNDFGEGFFGEGDFGL